LTAAASDARVRDLQAQAARARQELISVQVDLRTARGEADNLRAELSVAKTRIEELESQLKKAKSAPATATGEDLKVIKGIGPKFEKLLRSVGVTALAQIAAWSEADIDSIAAKLGVKAERIRKDDWVGNAKRLSTGG
jgi:predicted flap endonuclease-1-like 5' DNA nuclease